MPKISPGNMKLKNIPNISLTPCRGCRHDSPCRSGLCYAMKAYRQYPNVKKAWDQNLEEAIANPADYFAAVHSYVAKKRPSYFRWHVAGDILNQEYLWGMFLVARANPQTKFLAFTKMHSLDFTGKPKNLEIVFSLWPKWGMMIPEDKGQYAFMQDGTENRIGPSSFVCPGKCDTCKACWHLSKIGQDVVFEVH